MTALTFSKVSEAVVRTPRTEVIGRVGQVVGLVVESHGPNARVGDVCLVDPGEGAAPIPCEVVGFRGSVVLLMPLGEMVGIRAGSLVRGTGTCLKVPVGPELLGRTLDGLGNPIDGLGPLACEASYPNLQSPPNALERQMIEKPFHTSVKAIDACLTMGQGQRVGIFAGSEGQGHPHRYSARIIHPESCICCPPPPTLCWLRLDVPRRRDAYPAPAPPPTQRLQLSARPRRFR